MDNPVVALCEPDPGIRRLMARALVAAGIEVGSDEELRMARAWLRSRRALPKLMVVGEGVPVKALRDLLVDSNRGFPVLLVVTPFSAYHDLATEMSCPVIEKPFSIPGLLEAVRLAR